MVGVLPSFLDTDSIACTTFFLACASESYFSYSFNATAALNDYAFVRVGLGGKTGRAELDRTVPGMRIATVMACPTRGGTLVRFDDRNVLALHAGIGVAYPYGNSKVLPFEKRYFSGGANSVRGWGVRELGPGGYKGNDGRIDFINQTGDMKLDLNAEYRTPLLDRKSVV
mgnify:CR=1 FL=1